MTKKISNEQPFNDDQPIYTYYIFAGSILSEVQIITNSRNYQLIMCKLTVVTNKSKYYSRNLTIHNNSSQLLKVVINNDSNNNHGQMVIPKLGS